MPPKPRAPTTTRKASIVSKDAPPVFKVEKDDSRAMPPPPDPSPPLGILEPEMRALSGCLKSAAVKTGQIYGFYADTHKLGIQKHAPNPPRSLTSSLGREVEKYDQLCDTIESHLLRAISILRRDLVREEQRIKDAETASIATRTRSKSTSLSPTSTRIPLPPVPGPTDITSTIDASQPSTSDLPAPGHIQPSPPQPSSSVPLGRRPSAISISSLHRPPFPLKLDLSSTALRITPEEVFTSGLASPVTLAPKSARPTGPNEFPPELMAAFASSAANGASRSVDIDLTVPDTDNAGNDVEMNMDASIGNSADKPIELDLEAMDIDMSNMTDLFGDSADSSSNDANNAVDGLFSPVAAGADISIQGNDMAGKSIKEEEKLEMDILDALSAAGVGNSGSDDIFASLGANSEPSNQSEQNPQAQSLNVPSIPAGQSAPSPGSILASFASPSHLNVTDHPSSNTTTLSGGDTPFDMTSIDLLHLSPGFFTTATDSEMNLDDLLNMGGQEEAHLGTDDNVTKSIS